MIDICIDYDIKQFKLSGTHDEVIVHSLMRNYGMTLDEAVCRVKQVDVSYVVDGK